MKLVVLAFVTIFNPNMSPSNRGQRDSEVLIFSCTYFFIYSTDFMQLSMFAGYCRVEAVPDFFAHSGVVYAFNAEIVDSRVMFVVEEVFPDAGYVLVLAKMR